MTRTPTGYDIEAAVNSMDESEDNICALEEYRDQVTRLEGELNEI